MNCIYIGTFIKQRRKELKLTQEQVCVAASAILSLCLRIENGKQTPSKCYKCPLQRLGMPEALIMF